jgi:CheY-like chemotaxis protein
MALNVLVVDDSAVVRTMIVKTLRLAGVDLPIIVVSTEGSQTRIDRLLRKGVRFIHKPFAPEVVRETVSHITGVDNATHA